MKSHSLHNKNLTWSKITLNEFFIILLFLYNHSPDLNDWKTLTGKEDSNEEGLLQEETRNTYMVKRKGESKMRKVSNPFDTNGFEKMMTVLKSISSIEMIGLWKILDWGFYFLKINHTENHDILTDVVHLFRKEKDFWK